LDLFIKHLQLKPHLSPTRGVNKVLPLLLPPLPPRLHPLKVSLRSL
jgi:hypothetical protein